MSSAGYRLCWRPVAAWKGAGRGVPTTSLDVLCWPLAIIYTLLYNPDSMLVPSTVANEQAFRMFHKNIDLRLTVRLPIDS